MNKLIYPDEQILLVTSVDELQTMAHHLALRARKYKMTISSTIPKPMAIWRNHLQREQIVINNIIIEQVTDYT